MSDSDGGAATSRRALGVVSDDQFMSPQAGDSLQIERLSFALHHIAAPNQGWTSFRGVVLQLQFGNTRSMRISGSAVMVAPGVAIAAKHVVEPEAPALLTKDASVGFLATAITPAGVDIWRVHQIVFQERTDTVILLLVRKSAFHDTPRVTQAILSTRLTPMGEPVSICGFVASANHFDSSERLGGRIHISQGLVAEHFLNGRDSVMMPGPCFSVSVGTPGGLSGGPVFDQSGRVVGILSTSFGEGEDDISFVSMIHPILTEYIQPVWPPTLIRSATPLVHFHEALCEIEGREHLLAPSPQSGAFTYMPWS